MYMLVEGHHDLWKHREHRITIESVSFVWEQLIWYHLSENTWLDVWNKKIVLNKGVQTIDGFHRKVYGNYVSSSTAPPLFYVSFSLEKPDATKELWLSHQYMVL